MGFASGTITFRRFAVVGESPAQVDEEMVEKLSNGALRPGEFGIEEEEYGWSGGRHVLDGKFSFENNVYADCLFFALRVDTNRVPGSLKRAYQMMEEEAVAAENPSGFISKQQKKDVKETTRRKVDDDLRSGRFRRSKLFPVLWDLPAQTLYCAATGKAMEQLLELFERTFELKLVPLSAGGMGLRMLEESGKRRDYEDLRATRFVHGPDGESQRPEYPWVVKGPEPKDFLGNEFLLWLWHQIEQNEGAVETDAGEVTAFIDRSLELDCAYGQTGRDFLRGDGASRMPEALDALRTGKVPRKAGMIFHNNGQQFQFTLGAETLAFAAAKLPEVEEADNPRVLFEERIGLLRDLCKSVDNTYQTFLKARASSSWEGHTSKIRKWIAQSTKTATSGPAPVMIEVGARS